MTNNERHPAILTVIETVYHAIAQAKKQRLLGAARQQLTP